MMREKIMKFIIDGGILFIPKNGGLNGYVKDILLGIDVNEKIRIISIRGEDIPQRVQELVEKGIKAYGLTGDDLFDEYKLNNPNSSLTVLNTYDWFDTNAEFKRPALCLLNKTGKYEDIFKATRIAVNKKYEATSTNFLKEKNIKATVVSYSGDTETTVKEGVNDCCVDIVYGGSSRKNNNLEVVDIVRFSDIVLIGQKEPDNVWAKEYERIFSRRSKTGSYTSNLLQNQNEIIKKFGQEAAEFIQACSNNENIEGETLDVFYAVMVALASKGVGWRKIEESLQERWKK